MALYFTVGPRDTVNHALKVAGGKLEERNYEFYSKVELCVVYKNLVLTEHHRSFSFYNRGLLLCEQ